jgi:hypothetical protein
MFGFGLGFRLGLLQLDQGPRQALQVSRSPNTPDSDLSIFPMMIGSTHM